eukprot:scaffold9600_cov132-Isochrysis_galbana.AAC.4
MAARARALMTTTAAQAQNESELKTTQKHKKAYIRGRSLQTPASPLLHNSQSIAAPHAPGVVKEEWRGSLATTDH